MDLNLSTVPYWPQHMGSGMRQCYHVGGHITGHLNLLLDSRQNKGKTIFYFRKEKEGMCQVCNLRAFHSKGHCRAEYYST